MPNYWLNNTVGTATQYVAPTVTATNAANTNTYGVLQPQVILPATWVEVDTSGGQFCYSSTNEPLDPSYLNGFNQPYLDQTGGCVIPPSVIDVDEEDWAMNHDLYMEWARNRAVQFRVRTAEQRRQAEEALRLQQERTQEEARRREGCLTRSRELLLEHLTPAQRETFEKNKWFVVTGGRTATRYRINTGSVQGNIDVLKTPARTGEHEVSHRLCCHCALYEIPMYDHYLAQKLALELDEERFLSIANRY